jgi:curli biogenesis system outer membrane secretion channel CsgG
MGLRVVRVGAAVLCLAGCATTSSRRPSSTGSEDALKIGVDDLARGVTPRVETARKTSLAIVGFTPVMAEPKKPDPFSQYLVEELTTRLVTEGKVTVAERAQLDKVMGELQLQSSGKVSDSSAKQLGQLLGVDAVLVGTYTDLDDKVRINERIIATESGEVLAATSTTVKKTRTVAKLLGQPYAGGEEDKLTSTPIYKKWWFWTVVGAVAVGGTVGAVAATTGGDDRVATGVDGTFDPSTYGNK